MGGLFGGASFKWFPVMFAVLSKASTSLSNPYVRVTVVVHEKTDGNSDKPW